MSGYFDEHPWVRACLIAELHDEPKPMQYFVMTAVDIAIDKMMEGIYLKPKKQ